MNSKSNNHHARISSDIMRLLRQLTDVNITRVELTADFSECKVYVENGLAELEKAAGYLRTEIAKSIKMKQTPKLRFILDKGIKNAARVDELLKIIGVGADPVSAQ